MIQNKDLQCHKFILAVSVFFYPRNIKDSRSGNKKKSYHGIDWDFENALSQQLWMACNYLIDQRPRDLLFTLSGQAQLYLPQIISCQRHKKISFEEIFSFDMSVEKNTYTYIFTVLILDESKGVCS